MIWWQQDASGPNRNELQCDKHLRLCSLRVLIYLHMIRKHTNSSNGFLVIKSDILHGLNPNKSPGPDNLHPFALKATAAEILPMLTHIFQQSLNCGRLPAQWKQAYVCTPVYKKGNSTDPRNYCPTVSLTSVIC